MKDISVHFISLDSYPVPAQVLSEVEVAFEKKDRRARVSIWTEADLPLLPVNQAFWDSLKTPCERVDYLKWLILQERGGLYMDADYHLLHWDTSWEDRGMVLGAFSFYTVEHTFVYTPNPGNKTVQKIVKDFPVKFIYNSVIHGRCNLDQVNSIYQYIVNADPDEDILIDRNLFAPTLRKNTTLEDLKREAPWAKGFHERKKSWEETGNTDYFEKLSERMRIL